MPSEYLLKIFNQFKADKHWQIVEKLSNKTGDVAVIVFVGLAKLTLRLRQTRKHVLSKDMYFMSLEKSKTVSEVSSVTQIVAPRCSWDGYKPVFHMAASAAVHTHI